MPFTRFSQDGGNEGLVTMVKAMIMEPPESSRFQMSSWNFD